MLTCEECPRMLGRMKVSMVNMWAITKAVLLKMLYKAINTIFYIIQETNAFLNFLCFGHTM